MAAMPKLLKLGARNFIWAFHVSDRIFHCFPRCNIKKLNQKWNVQDSSWCPYIG